MSLPLEIFDQHVAIVGKTGSGKSYTAKGAIERLLDAGRRVCIIDPTGVHWGLKSSRDGKKAGYPVVIFGGDHADIPINEHSARALAEFVAGPKAPPVIIDISLFLIGQKHRFMIEFAQHAYRANRTPLNLVIDEADEFMPQKPLHEATRMLHHMDRIVRRGRARGFRVTMITQRPAVLNKDVLTQAQTLIAMRLIGPQDRNAIEAWVKDQADPEKGRAVIASLPRLKVGEGWVWAPELGIFDCMTFPRIKTYDSSRAPEDGEDRGSVTVADVDLKAIRERFVREEEEARENDPKALKAMIRDLERRIEKSGGGASAAEVEQARQEGRERGRAEGEIHGKIYAVTHLKTAMDGLQKAGDALLEQWGNLEVHAYKQRMDARDKAPRERTRSGAGERRPCTPEAVGLTPAGFTMQHSQLATERGHGRPPNHSLTKAEAAFLTVLAQRNRPLARNRVAIFAGYSVKSGHIDNTLGALRSKGLAEGRNDAIRITEAGLEALGPFDPLPTGEALRRYWLGKVDKAGRAFLEVLFDIFPGTIARNELAERTGYSPGSGHVDNTLGRLRSLDLAEGRNDAIRAAEELFDG